MELFPIRCITCGKVLADKQSQYDDLISQGYTVEEALDRVGFWRICCRTRAMNPEVHVFTNIDRPTRKRSDVAKIYKISEVAAIGGKSSIQKPRTPKTPTPIKSLAQIKEAKKKTMTEIRVESKSPTTETEKPKVVLAPLNLEGVDLTSLTDLDIIPENVYT